MSNKNLAAAKTAHAAAVEAVQAARANLAGQQTASSRAALEAADLEAEISSGNADVAGQHILAVAKADDLSKVIGAYARAVQVAEATERRTRFAVTVEALRHERGDLLHTGEVAALIEKATQDVDAILFELGDKLAAHNDALSSAIETVKADSAGTAPDPAVHLKPGAVSGTVLTVDGHQFETANPSTSIKQATKNSAIRYNADRNAAAIAASAEADRLRREVQATTVRDLLAGPR